MDWMICGSGFVRPVLIPMWDWSTGGKHIQALIRDVTIRCHSKQRIRAVFGEALSAFKQRHSMQVRLMISICGPGKAGPVPAINSNTRRRYSPAFNYFLSPLWQTHTRNKLVCHCLTVCVICKKWTTGKSLVSQL